jgi:hypothetical protein
MRARRREVLGLAGRALLLLPVFLLAWHLASTPLAWIAGRLALPAIALVADGKVALSLDGSRLRYAVTLEMPYRPGGASPAVVAEPQVVAGQFTFGLALFLALVAASRRESGRAAGIVAGAAGLAMLPAFGVAFDVLRQLGSSPELQPFLRWSPVTREAIALGYQVGSLLLPALAPVAVWLYLARGLWAPSDADTPSPLNRS